jgi:SAM-dependent methyltransferase
MLKNAKALVFGSMRQGAAAVAATLASARSPKSKAHAQPMDITPVLTLKERSVGGLAVSTQFNEMTNPNKWENPEWLAIHKELRTYSVDVHCFADTKEFAYRKGWEWTQALWGLQRLGMIHSETQGLGVGAGREPLLFYLSDRIKSVTGTDLYGNEAWSTKDGKEAAADLLAEPTKFCPRPFHKERLKLMNMDGTELRFDDGQFDFVWSLSSIEHFGSHDAATAAIREMARVTRPYGIVVVATELIVTPGIQDHPEYFTIEMFERHVVRATDALLPLQPMSYQLPDLEYLLDPIMVNLGQDVHRRRHHIILNDGKNQWTSAIMFFRKL